MFSLAQMGGTWGDLSWVAGRSMGIEGAASNSQQAEGRGLPLGHVYGRMQGQALHFLSAMNGMKKQAHLPPRPS